MLAHIDRITSSSWDLWDAHPGNSWAAPVPPHPKDVLYLVTVGAILVQWTHCDVQETNLKCFELCDMVHYPAGSSDQRLNNSRSYIQYNSTIAYIYLKWFFIKSLKDVQALTLHMLSPARLARTHYMFLIGQKSASRRLLAVCHQSQHRTISQTARTVSLHKQNTEWKTKKMLWVSILNNMIKIELNIKNDGMKWEEHTLKWNKPV